MVRDFQVVGVRRRQVLLGRVRKVRSVSNLEDMGYTASRQRRCKRLVLNTLLPSLGSMNTIWYSCLGFRGCRSSLKIEKWNTVVPVSSKLRSPCAMISVRRKPYCEFAGSPPGTKTDELSILMCTVCSIGLGRGMKPPVFPYHRGVGGGNSLSKSTYCQPIALVAAPYVKI